LVLVNVVSTTCYFDLSANIDDIIVIVVPVSMYTDGDIGLSNLSLFSYNHLSK